MDTGLTEGVKTLNVAPNQQERLVKEAMYIRLSTPGVRMKERRSRASGKVP